MLNVQEQATQHVAVPIAVPVAPPQPLQMGQRADPQGTPQQLTLADGRMLYVNSSGWACCELPSTHTNNDAVRRTWYLGSDGLLTLDDGRQLYANPQGRVGVALPETHTNNDAARRTWHLGSDGVLTLNDGRQLHCTIDTILPSEKKKKKSKDCCRLAVYRCGGRGHEHGRESQAVDVHHPTDGRAGSGRPRRRAYDEGAR